MFDSRLKIVVNGMDSELARYTLEPGEYIVGRSATASVRVDANLVSRAHALLIVGQDGSVTVEDLGSSNGTHLDGNLVTAPTPWLPGQILCIGETSISLASDRHDLTPTLSASQMHGAGQALVPFEPTPPLRTTPVSIVPAPRDDEALTRYIPLRERRAQDLTIGEEVARGGMGVVVAAHESATRRTVAMKVMLDGSSEGNTLRFIEEAQVTAQLEHPNIVPIYDLGIDSNGQPYYTMKLVQGITLKKVIELLREGTPGTIAKYPLGTLLTIFQKVCDAIAFAHSRGVIHRDLKPANIMLGKYGEVMVMDWGLAKIIGTDRSRSNATHQIEATVTGARRQDLDSFGTMAGLVMGTPHYMSPEQARGEVETLDQRSDIYTLGVILYELLTLERPVSGQSAAELLEKILSGKHETPAQRVRSTPRNRRPVHLLGGEVPESLDAIVRKAMALDRDHRYADISALQADLLAYQNGFATGAERAGAWKQLKLFVARNRAVASTAAAALVLLVGISAAFTVNVVNERNRAEHALSDLRRTAPTLAAQARELVAQQKLDEAIEKVGFAIAIDPRNAAYLVQRANYLQAAERFPEAVAAYRTARAVSNDPTVADNLALSEKLAAAKPAPSTAALNQLYDAMRAQKRDLEVVSLGVKLGFGGEATLTRINSALEPWMKLPEWKTFENGKRVRRRTDGSFELILSSLPIHDLTPLAKLNGAPIYAIWAEVTLISDLSPLAGLPLRELYIGRSPVSDLSPLLGTPLLTLNADNTKVRDLPPLQGMRLTTLSLDGTLVESLEPLRGAALTSLNISRTKVASLTPLMGMPLCRLAADSTSIENLGGLEGAPIEGLNFNDCQRLTTLESLRGGKTLRTIGLIGSPNIRNLSPLAGQPIAGMSIQGTSVSRLDGLEQSRMEWIACGESVRDISALRGMPLVAFDYHGDTTKIADLSPLLECQSLRRLGVGGMDQRISVMRSLISINKRPPEEYWAALERAKK